MRPMQAASASILALRDRVAATAADVSTISISSIVHNLPARRKRAQPTPAIAWWWTA
jgi:hypothetical protein